MRNEYDLQAKEFLAKTGTIFDFQYLGKATPEWDKINAHDKYQIKLSNKKSTEYFEFYDSLNNSKNIKKSVSAYDVLSVLYPDYFENFEDFCIAYGYSTDSISAFKTYLAVVDESKKLLRLFTENEIEELCEIQ